MKPSLIISVSASLLMFGSCVDYAVADPESQRLAVSVNVVTDAPSKSFVSPDEDRVDNLVLVVYGNGRLHSVSHSQNVGMNVVELYPGEVYNIYALANFSDIQAEFKESDFVESFVWHVRGPEDFQEHLPMVGCATGILVEDDMEAVEIFLERLVSKVCLSIDKTALTGLSVDAVRLRQCSSMVYPFCDMGEGGSMALAVDEVHDGDHASSDDLVNLNSGGSVFFYAPENIRGILLPENDDPWLKIPDSIDGHEGLATYVEVECSFLDSPEYEGSIICRFYLGRDNCSDFSIIRNSCLNVVLTLTEGAVRKVSWKVEPDVQSLLEFTDYIASLGEYVYEYSCLEFPTATVEDPVVLESGGAVMTVTGDSSAALTMAGYDSAGRQESYFILLPSDPRKVYLRTMRTDEPMEIRMTQGLRSKNIVYSPKKMTLGLSADGSVDRNVVSVNESGLTGENAYVYLVDCEDGNLLSLSRFFYPEALADYYGEDQEYPVMEASVSISDDEGEYGRSYRYRYAAQCGAYQGENHLCCFEFHGLDSEGVDVKEIPLELYEENFFDSMPSQQVILNVNAAFPSQGHIGEYQNMQFAPGDMRSLTIDLDGLEKEFTTGATWELRRVGIDDVDVMPDESLWIDGEECRASVSSFSRLSLRLSDMYSGYEEYIPCGAMMLKGTVTNPFTGREIVGYYTFDLVLFLSVGVQVDISGYDMHYSFVPFSEYSVPGYHEFWNSLLGSRLVVQAQRHYGAGSVDVNVLVKVPESIDYNTMYYTLPEAFSEVGQDLIYDEIINVLEPLSIGLLDFDFVAGDGSLYSSLELTRTGAAGLSGYENMVHGKNGYFRVVRQRDLANLPVSNGLENHMIEAAYGSFENY